MTPETSPQTEGSFPLLGVRLDHPSIDRFTYLKNGGPNTPSRVRYIEMFEYSRIAGWLSYLTLVALISSAALFLWIAVSNLLVSNVLNTIIGFAITSMFAFAAIVVINRIRNAKTDSAARDNDDYRVGLYFDGEFMLLRFSNAVSVFPRSCVDGARVHSKYDSESKRTVCHLLLCYSNSTGERFELWLENTFGMGLGPLITIITRWKNGGDFV